MEWSSLAVRFRHYTGRNREGDWRESPSLPSLSFSVQSRAAITLFWRRLFRTSKAPISLEHARIKSRRAHSERQNTVQILIISSNPFEVEWIVSPPPNGGDLNRPCHQPATSTCSQVHITANDLRHHGATTISFGAPHLRAAMAETMSHSEATAARTYKDATTRSRIVEATGALMEMWQVSGFL